MDWDDLKHFLAVTRSHSLTEAARTLKTSPATVGRRVAALEKGLDARLFDRRPTGYTLTSAGENLRAKAEGVESAILAVERTALDNNAQHQKVRIASTEDMAASLIVPNLVHFGQRNPHLSIELHTQQNVVDLVRREADISLRQVRPTQGNVVIKRAGAWPLALYASQSYATARGLRPGRIDFANIELITWIDDLSHLRGGPWFAKHAPNARVALTANSRRVHQAACKAGLGVAILPSVFGDAEPDLVCILPPERVVTLDVWIVVHRDISRSKHIRALMNFLRECVAKYSK